ncbi:hypothetical protein D9M72_359840 [compost metagenome]
MGRHARPLRSALRHGGGTGHCHRRPRPSRRSLAAWLFCRQRTGLGRSWRGPESPLCAGLRHLAPDYRCGRQARLSQAAARQVSQPGGALQGLGHRSAGLGADGGPGLRGAVAEPRASGHRGRLQALPAFLCRHLLQDHRRLLGVARAQPHAAGRSIRRHRARGHRGLRAVLRCDQLQSLHPRAAAWPGHGAAASPGQAADAHRVPLRLP